MNAPALTLPPPAAELWRRIGATVREEVGSITGAEAGYAIGGGSILGARWEHRYSYDVDLTVPPDTPLGMFAEANNPACRFEARMRALGGTPAFNGDVKLWRVSFDDGERKLDLWASAPLLGAGEQPCTIDGRPETVLSTAQILRGKLERSDEHLARDVFDIAKASEKAPEALEAAVNAISRPLAESIAQSFHWAAPAIAVEAEGTLGGVPADEGIPPRQLGNRGAHAISNALYTMCSIRTRDGAIEVATATRAQGEKTRRIEATSAEHDFEAAGLNAYLRAKGPGPRALLDYARESCARCQDALVFEADADGVKAWRTAKAAMNAATADPRR